MTLPYTLPLSPLPSLARSALALPLARVPSRLTPAILAPRSRPAVSLLSGAAMLVPLPLRDQLDEPPGPDGVDENPQANCVPASLSSIVTALTGRVTYGDEMKDAVYGSAFTGATDPAAYIPWLAAHGIKMVELHDTQQALMDVIISSLQAGMPVSAAIPSQWGLAPQPDPVHQTGGTHEVSFCDWDGLNLTAMNPWPIWINGVLAKGFYQTQPLAWWLPRVVYGRVFPCQSTQGGSPVLTGYTDLGGGSIRCNATGVVLSHAMAYFVQTNPAVGDALRAEEYTGGNGGDYAFVPFRMADGSGVVATYINKVGDPLYGHVVTTYGGPMLAAIAGDRDAQRAQVASLTQQIAALKAAPVAPVDPLAAQALAVARSEAALLTAVAAAK